MLIVMAGLPGSGKSSIADALGRRLPAPVVSVDPIEAAMLRAGVSRGEPTGLAAYVVAEAVADSALSLGQTVIVDAVNAVEAARRQWRELAVRHATALEIIEVICSDPIVHRRRLEGRSRGIEGFQEPSWEAVELLRNEYEPWIDRRLVLDSMTDIASNTASVFEYLSASP